MDNFRLSSIYVTDMRFTMGTSAFMICSLFSIGMGYLAKEDAKYVREILDSFNPAHIVIGYGLFWIALLVGLMIIVLMVTVFFDRSSKMKYGIIAILFSAGCSVILGFYMAIQFYNEPIPTTKDIMYHNIRDYEFEPDSTRIINKVQKELSCCGVYNYTDWSNNKKFACASHSKPLDCGIPKSCCINNTGVNDWLCGYESMFMKLAVKQNRVWPKVNMSEETVMYTEGCLLKIVQMLAAVSVRMAVRIAVVFFAQVFSLLVSVKLSSQIKKLHVRSSNENNSIELNNRRRLPGRNCDRGNLRYAVCDTTAETELGTEPQSNNFNSEVERNLEAGFDRGSSGMIQPHSINSSRSGGEFPTSIRWKGLEKELSDSDSSQKYNTDNTTEGEFAIGHHETEPQTDALNPVLEPNPETAVDPESSSVTQSGSVILSRSGDMLPTSENWVKFDNELSDEEDAQQFKPDDLIDYMIRHPPMVRNPDDSDEKEFVTEPQSHELNPIPEPNPEIGFDPEPSYWIQSDTTSSSRSDDEFPFYENWSPLEDTQKFNNSMIRHPSMDRNPDDSDEKEFVTEPQSHELNPIYEPNLEICSDPECSYLIQSDTTSSSRSDEEFSPDENWSPLEDTQKFNNSMIRHPSMDRNPDDSDEKEFVTEPQSHELNLISEPNPEICSDPESSYWIQSDTTSSSRSDDEFPASENWFPPEENWSPREDTQEFNEDNLTELLSLPSPVGFNDPVEEADE